MQNSIKQGNAIQAVYTMRPPFTSMHLHFLAALCCFPKIGESASKPWRVLFWNIYYFGGKLWPEGDPCIAPKRAQGV